MLVPNNQTNFNYIAIVFIICMNILWSQVQIHPYLYTLNLKFSIPVLLTHCPKEYDLQKDQLFIKFFMSFFN